MMSITSWVLGWAKVAEVGVFWKLVSLGIAVGSPSKAGRLAESMSNCHPDAGVGVVFPGCGTLMAHQLVATRF